jgi:hypothetical protein
MMAVVGTLGYRHIELSMRRSAIQIGIVMVINLSVIGHGGDGGMSTTAFDPGKFFTGAPGIALLRTGRFHRFRGHGLFRDEARDRRGPSACDVSRPSAHRWLRAIELGDGQRVGRSGAVAMAADNLRAC